MDRPSFSCTLRMNPHLQLAMLFRTHTPNHQRSIMKKRPLLIIAMFLLSLSGCNTQASTAFQQTNSWILSSSDLIVALMADNKQLATGVGSVTDNVVPSGPLVNPGKLDQPLTHDQDSSVASVLIIIVIFLILVAVALIYFYKSQFFSQHNSETTASKNIRYDSKISLCSLVFDPLNCILHFSHGKNHTQINFSEITGYKMTVNSNCLLKVSQNPKQIFNTGTEESLRHLFNDIESEKLLEDETREISLEILCEPEAVQPVPINFYYREGDLRLSSRSFLRSVDDVMLWCHLLESAIRPVANNTEVENHESQTSTTNKEDTIEPITQLKPTKSEVKPKPTARQTTDHDLADELTRLAELKINGFLSEEEFQKAKEKIINQ